MNASASNGCSSTLSDEDLPHYMRGTRAIKNERRCSPEWALHRQEMKEKRAEETRKQREAKQQQAHHHHHSSSSRPRSNSNSISSLDSSPSPKTLVKSDSSSPEISSNPSARPRYDYRKAMKESYAQVMERRAAERRAMNMQRQTCSTAYFVVPNYMRGTKAVPGVYDAKDRA